MTWGRVEIDLDLREVATQLVDAVAQSTLDAARAAPEHVCEHLRAGRKPDGSPQPQNAASTLETKQRLGQGSVPGVASGLLSDPTEWDVVATLNGASLTVEITPPRSRWDVIDYLEPLDCEFVGIPTEFGDDWEAYLREAWGRIQ